METRDVLKKHEKSFNKTRIMLKVLMIIILAFMAYIQKENLIRLYNWLFNSN